MSEDLVHLIKLQALDNGISELQAKTKSLEDKIRTKSKVLEGLKDNLKSHKDRLNAIQLKKKELELDADTKDKLVKKYQSELNTLKSNDAYKAMLGEIEKGKAEVRKVEDQLLDLMEETEKLQAEFKKKEADNKILENNFRQDIKQLEDQKTANGDEEKTKTEERNQFASTVPEPLLRQYDGLRLKKGGVAIVPITGATCGGCQMNMTPNKANEVLKGKNIILCDSCNRILYVPQAPTAVVTPPPTVPAVPAEPPTADQSPNPQPVSPA